MLRLLPLLVFTACTVDPPEKQDSTPAPDMDADGDGFSAEAGDCNDGDAAIGPTQQEICDGLDNNCNGEADEGVSSTFWADRDADGFGDPASPTEGCQAPAGSIANDRDCDDANPLVYPSATEICDDLDNDCDGQTDEDVSETWYADNDLDGFGDPANSFTGCTQPGGFLGDAQDCDDAAASVHPGVEEHCDGVDEDCDGSIDEDPVDAPTWYLDGDGDGYAGYRLSVESCSQPEGYTDEATDCDDGAASTFPGADERCNGADDDCDLSIDEDAVDASLFYADSDGDRYGDPAVTVDACSAPTGYVTGADDCDDSDRKVNPAATEVCNSVDDDCNGQIDDAVSTTQWYLDADGDSYGDPGSSPITSCTQPSGYVSDSADCNDGNKAIHPGATESCNNVDDDCDGVVDDNATGLGTWYLDTDGDGYGDTATSKTACNQPSGYVSKADDCDETDKSINPGAADACDGIDNDCTGDIDDAGLCPCDVVQYGGHAYQFCTANKSWSDARTSCNSYGYELATVNDAAENSFLIGEAATYSGSTNPYFWIGYTDALVEGSFGWASGSSSSYTDWNSGEPNNLFSLEDCVVLYYNSGGGHWNDWVCSYTATYLCESE